MLISDKGGTFTDLRGNKIKMYSWSQTSVGEGDGLFGFNCQHVKWPFINGFNIPRKTNPMEELNEEIKRTKNRNEEDYYKDRYNLD
jgi:hypothetical protein